MARILLVDDPPGSALAAAEAFAGAGGPLDADLVRSAFSTVQSPGRLEVVRTSPTIIIDATHNPAGARATMAAVAEAFAFRRLVGVLAVFSDKDANGILEILEPHLSHLVVTQSSSGRAMPADDLATIAADIFGMDRVDVAIHLDEAIDLAVERADEDDDFGGAGVLIIGSVAGAGEARRLLKRR